MFSVPFRDLANLYSDDEIMNDLRGYKLFVFVL